MTTGKASLPMPTPRRVTSKILRSFEVADETSNRSSRDRAGANGGKRNGLTAGSASIGTNCGSKLGAHVLSRLNPFEEVPGKRQSDQFRFHRKLAKCGLHLVDDPLFRCDVRQVHQSGRGRVQAQMVYRGLRIKGHCMRPRIVELLLDGHLIRRDRVGTDERAADYWLFVNRPALERFPKRAELEVRSSDAKTGEPRVSTVFDLQVPHGESNILEIIDLWGLIDKKGNLPISDEEFARKQREMLLLYERVSKVFEQLFDRHLFLLYGTLLGLYRDGDFIPGDDDFDVGYVSEHRDPREVKREAKELIERLALAGFGILLNRKGKPMKIFNADGDPGIHLDACPVWHQEDRVWTNPYGCLPISMEGFRRVQPRKLRDTEVAVPDGTESFLRAYYGEDWETPDSDYTLSRPLSPRVKRNLLAICLRPAEVRELKARIEKRGRATEGAGQLHSKALEALYPLERYEAICGWD